MAKVLMIHPDKCTGCRNCELACSFEHERRFRPGASRVQAFTWEREGISVPMMCQQCDDAACVTVCPTGAMHHSTTTQALIDWDADKCIRCRMCVIACPFGNARYDATDEQHLQVRQLRRRTAVRRLLPHQGARVRGRHRPGQGAQEGLRGQVQGRLPGGELRCTAGQAPSSASTSAPARSRARPLDPKVAREYIGARGLGGYIIRSEVDPKTDALSPANKLVFATGPLTGTFAPSAGRYNVVTKGPLNESLAASNSGGAFGPELKYAGYDAVIVEGKAAKPVYLWIKDDEVEIRDAADVWGHTVPDTTDTDPRGDRRRGQGGLHRSGRRAPGAGRQHHERHAPRRGAHRRRRGHGLQEPQGRGRRRQRRRQGRRPRRLPRRGAQGPPDDLRRPGRRHRPAGLRHRGAGQHPQPGRRPAHAQLAGRLLRRAPTRPAARRSRPSSSIRKKGCFSCIICVRPGDQGRRPRLRGHRRGPRVRDRLGLRRRLRRRRPGRHHQGQLPLQRVRHGHHRVGLLDRLRHGALPARHHHDQGHRRRGPHLGQRRGHRRDDAQDGRGRWVRRQGWRRARTASPTATATPSTP